MKKIGFLLTLFAFIGMISFSSCKQGAEENESTEEALPAEEQMEPAEDEMEPYEDIDSLDGESTIE